MGVCSPDRGDALKPFILRASVGVNVPTAELVVVVVHLVDVSLFGCSCFGKIFVLIKFVVMTMRRTSHLPFVAALPTWHSIRPLVRPRQSTEGPVSPPSFRALGRQGAFPGKKKQPDATFGERSIWTTYLNFFPKNPGLMWYGILFFGRPTAHLPRDRLYARCMRLPEASVACLDAP